MTPYYDKDGVTLYAGDAIAVLQSLPDASVDAVVTDPPYSSGGAFRSDRMGDTTSKYVQTGVAIARPDFGGDNRDQRSYLAWCAIWLAECLRVAKPGSPICVFSDWRQLPVTTDAVQAGGWIWRGIVPWNKTEATRPQMGRFRAQCEYVVWGSAGPMPQRTDVGVLPGFFEAGILQAEKLHLTGKPVSVMREIVRVSPPPRRCLGPVCGQRDHLPCGMARGPAGHRHRAQRGVLADCREAPARRPLAVQPLREGV